MSKSGQGLVYFISETHHFEQKQSVAVVGLVGALVERNTHSIEGCLEAIGKLACRAVVLNFRDISPELDASTVDWVRKLRQAARVQGATLIFSALHPQVRTWLERGDAIQGDEVANNLAQALEALAIICRAA